MDQEAIALEAYETLAEAYAARVETKPHNAYYERPATLSLLPDVVGQRVLDAGCGPGVYAEWLLDHGADVVAFDASPQMVDLARERLGDRAEVVEADLDKTLHFLEDGDFDVVLSALALDYVRDLRSTFEEFHRVLREPGLFVFSLSHPFAEFMLHPSGSYFETELITYEWTGFGVPVEMPSYRRPLEALLNPLVEAGFALDRIVEPTPTERFREELPEDYEKLSRQPGFLCVRARKGRGGRLDAASEPGC